MTFMPGKNTAKMRILKARVFDGLGGPETQILKRTDDRGRDTSITIANEILDLDLGERGSMVLRPGKTKKSTTGESESINAIFQVTIGGKLQYGIVAGGNLDLLSLPQEGEYLGNPFELPKEDKPDDWPSGLEWIDDVKDDFMSPDPSLPANDQVCPEGYTISDDPATRSFSMIEGGSLPADQNWYFFVEGRWFNSLEATFSTPASWYSTKTTGIWAFTTGPCNALDINQIAIQVNGKDSDGNDLTAGTYTDTLTLTWNDGTVLDVVITLNVLASIAVIGTDVKNKPGSDSVWATAVTEMEGVAWAAQGIGVNANLLAEAHVSGGGTYEAWTYAIIFDTSAYNGVSISNIEFTIGTNSDGSRAGRINVKTHSAATPPNNTWAWADGGPTAVIGTASGVNNDVALSASVTLDDYLFIICQFAPWTTAPTGPADFQIIVIDTPTTFTLS